MVIDTIINVGDVVWYIHDNVVNSSTVSRIDISVVNPGPLEVVVPPKTIIQFSTTHGKFTPERIFSSREALADFILNGSE